MTHKTEGSAMFKLTPKNKRPRKGPFGESREAPIRPDQALDRIEDLPS